MGKKKLAVLGGGMGSLSAVYALTNEPGWEANLEITVHQLGWRLGGKAATSRDLDAGARIEEHGYHTLFGFYENTFAVMRDVYAKYARDPSLPISELIAPDARDEARYPGRYGLHREDFFIMLQQLADSTWHEFPIEFPRNSDLPGDGSFLPSPLAYLEMAIELLIRLLDGKLIPDASLHAPSSPPSYWSNVLDSHPEVLEGLDPLSEESNSALGHLEVARRLAHRLASDESLAVDSAAAGVILGLFVGVLRVLLRVLWLVVGGRVDAHWPSYLAWTTCDFVCTTLIGIIEDGVLWKGFDAIDDVNFWQWIEKHGTVAEGTRVTNSSMWVQAAYDSSFAYLGGDSTAPRTPEKPPLGNPTMGAGTMLRGGMRLMLAYKGAMAWKFQAGTAEVLVSPIYQVLRQRGVRFEFFSKVTNLGVGGEAGALTIDSIAIQRQVKLKQPGVEYEPLVVVKDVPCWPSEPLWDQIEGAEGIRQYDLESYWTPWPGVENSTLTHGTDFDLVLLGIPVGMLAVMTPELASASAKWKAMITDVLTVRTEAIQTWMTTDLRGLGWTGADAPVNVGVQPLDTWADMTQLLARETWPEGSGPASVQYFCSAMRDDPNQPLPPSATYAATQTASVFEHGVAFFERQSTQFWPSARTPSGGFDWSLLFPAVTGVGPDALKSQFIRGNIDPNERYVLSVPGSSPSRIAADGSDFGNLTLAGDWTLNGLNVGCMEATVTSGLLASKAIAGYPSAIFGLEDFGPPKRS